MTEQRYSLWHIVGVLVIVLSVGALGLVGGLFMGYQWGRAEALAAVLNTRAQGGPDQPQRTQRPSGPTFNFQLPPRPNPPNVQDTNVQGRVFLGVEFEMTAEGALVLSVVADSAAQAAGIKEGDVIQQVAGKQVQGENGLRRLLSQYAPGDEVTLTVLRNGNEREVTVTLGEAGVTDK